MGYLEQLHTWGGAHCAPPIFSMCSTNGNAMKLSEIRDLGKLCLHAKFWSFGGHCSHFMTSQRLKTIENNRNYSKLYNFR